TTHTHTHTHTHTAHTRKAPRLSYSFLFLISFCSLFRTPRIKSYQSEDLLLLYRCPLSWLESY
ncbi:hypothetical protein THAOC_36453, partial [Thalassiosira oceanica]